MVQKRRQGRREIYIWFSDIFRHTLSYGHLIEQAWNICLWQPVWSLLNEWIYVSGISVKHTGTHTFSEKVWVLVYSWSLYIQTRNIQGLTPFQNVLEKCQIWKGVSSCMFLQLMSFGQEHTRTYTFSRFFENRVTSSGVSPCMFHVCIYKNQEHTRSHTFSKNHENFLKTYKNSHLFNSFHFNQTTIKLFVDGTP